MHIVLVAVVAAISHVTAAAAAALIMSQDKSKKHPVFDDDRQQHRCRRHRRFCTDYPIIILRSPLRCGRQEFCLPFCHLICARESERERLFLSFLLLRLVSLFFMKMGDIEGCLVLPATVPLLYIEIS